MCSKLARVVGRIEGRALCDACYRRHPVGFRDCIRCREHRRIRRTGLCDQCTINDLCEELFTPDLLATSSSARSLRDALVNASTQRTVAVFLRPKSIELLRTVMAEPSELTHERLDTLGGEQATLPLRSALIEHGLLDPVDIHLRRLEQWIDRASEVIADPTVRTGFIQYATWKHLRELRAAPGPVSRSRASSRRRELRIILDLLGWAHHRGLALPDLGQAHIDRWAMTGKERHRVNGFLRWAYRNKLARSLYLPPPRSAGRLIDGLNDQQRATLLSRVLRDDNISAGTQLAAALILLYGTGPHRIAHIELSQLSSHEGIATIRLGEDHLHLPEELNLVTTAVNAARDGQRLLHTVHDTHWLFPGRRPGYPISPATLTKRLQRIGIPITKARRGAILSLADDVHPVVLAHLTGIHISTAISWRNAISTSHARYLNQLLSHTRTESPAD